MLVAVLLAGSAAVTAHASTARGLAHASTVQAVHSGCGDGQAYGLTVGVYNTTVCNETAWTFRSLFKGATEILSPLGFTQSVAHVNIPPSESRKRWPPLEPVVQPVVPVNSSAQNGFVGTGHGGEFVFGLTLTSSADAKEYDLLRVGHGTPMPAAGLEYPPNTTLRATKRSQIGPYLATETVELHPAFGLNVSSTLSLAFANSSYEYVDYFYAAMTMFALPFKRWVAQRLDGSFTSGTFTFDMSFSLHADIRWTAVFDDASGQGAVFQFPGGHAPLGSADGFKNSFWNRKYDHKLYLRIDPPKRLGVPVTIEHTVRGFWATNETWVEVAKGLVRGWPTRTASPTAEEIVPAAAREAREAREARAIEAGPRGGPRFSVPVMIARSDPNISSGGPTGPQHCWFADDGAVIADAIVTNVRHGCDGCKQAPLPHPHAAYVSWDGGQSYSLLSQSTVANPNKGYIPGHPTYNRASDGALVGSCCMHRASDNRSFVGGSTVVHRTYDETAGRRVINQTVVDVGAVSYAGFPYNVARFTYASRIVSSVTTTSGEQYASREATDHLVQLRAFSHYMDESHGPDENLAAFGSSDGGVNWAFLATIATRNASLAAKGYEGPGENDLVALGDGRLLAVFRVESCQPYWSAMSVDGGRTWSAPQALAFGSVRPKLVRLGDGRVVLTGGRPGLFMWIATPTAAVGAEHWKWQTLSVPSIHNSMLLRSAAAAGRVEGQRHPEWLYGDAFVAAGPLDEHACTAWNSTADRASWVQGSSSYTSLLDLGSGRYVLMYDRLANGWSPPVWDGKPGTWGDRDYVFSMAFEFNATA